MNTFKDDILRKIKAGDVGMKPRWYFTLQAAMFILSVVIVAIVAIYLLSFVLFALQQSGVWFAPLFGFRGLVFLVVSSPWLLIVLTGLFLAILAILVKRYSFSYRKPFVYSLLGIVFFVISTSLLLASLTIHERVNSFIEKHEVPGFSPLYRAVGQQRPAGVVLGEIMEVRTDSLLLITEDEEIVTVLFDAYTKQPKNKLLEKGDQVLVFGDKKQQEIKAFGIKLANDKKLAPVPRRHHEQKFD